MQSEQTPPVSTDVLHKELDLVQAIVQRMAANSFQVKAWLVGILSALIVFGKDYLLIDAKGEEAAKAKEVALLMNILLFLPIACFWYLDGFFLATERLYREVYKWLVKHRPHSNAYLYDLNTFTRTTNGQEEKMLKPENTAWRQMWSKTLLPFYLMPLVLATGLLLYNLFRL